MKFPLKLLVTSRMLICVSENMRQVMSHLEEPAFFTASKVKDTISCLGNSTGIFFFLFVATCTIYLWFINLHLFQCSCALPIYCTSRLHLNLELNMVFFFFS